MGEARKEFEELVIQAKQAKYMEEMLYSDEITEDDGLGMTDDEFYDFQEQYFNLLGAVKDGAKTIYPEMLFMYADERRAQLQALKTDENADTVDIEKEEAAIDMVVGFWKSPVTEDTPTE